MRIGASKVRYNTWECILIIIALKENRETLEKLAHGFMNNKDLPKDIRNK